MPAILATPWKSLAAGVALAFLVLGYWLAVAGADRGALLGFAWRSLHVAAAFGWVGAIVHVNFVQLVALPQASDQQRRIVERLLAPRLARLMRYTSHVVIASGAALLVTSGYLIDRLMFTPVAYMPPLRNQVLWAGAAGGLAMWVFVHRRILPALSRVTAEPPLAEADLAQARATVARYARINLILAVPVTLAMVAAGHLY